MSWGGESLWCIHLWRMFNIQRITLRMLPTHFEYVTRDTLNPAAMIRQPRLLPPSSPHLHFLMEVTKKGAGRKFLKCVTGLISRGQCRGMKGHLIKSKKKRTCNWLFLTRHPEAEHSAPKHAFIYSNTHKFQDLERNTACKNVNIMLMSGDTLITEGQRWEPAPSSCTAVLRPGFIWSARLCALLHAHTCLGCLFTQF